ncbi:Ceramide kinase [Hibiscus syriacus]|uniref:Ceramide kinase n=1 Tax=Hibiscus syriacus TaxID=106335 RepID=A0A6A3AG12_HIBSY|nr:ceramide kinase-like [Hibiscus syriacus]KAE8703474.1 Ceramide kinase [Hibiscus syriacus]
MEINGGRCNSGNKSQVEGEISVLSSNLFLDHVGEVTLTFDSDGLSWKSLDSLDNDGSTCLGIKFLPKMATKLIISDIYAVELMNGDVIQESDLTTVTECFLGSEDLDSGMNHFTVHTFQKSKSQPCLWILAAYTFGHKDLQTCQMWVNKISGSLHKEVGRPKNLLVFVHPLSGKGNGRNTWETVAPIFSRSKINTKVIVTQRAGHAFDVMRSTTNEELNSYDGVLAVGGDGFFNEILNGYLSSRHKAPFPPVPSDFLDALGNDNNPLVNITTEADSESRNTKESDPLLSGSAHNESGFSHLRTNDGSLSLDQQIEYSLPYQRLRFGIIPAGSTDAIVICTTGARDPITSALHIILGKRLCLDVAQVVRWKTTSTSKIEPLVRYAASFAGYGFYGDVITESEKYRWMGPKRYDYAGTKVFLKHRSYEVEVGYLAVESEKDSSTSDGSRMLSKSRSLKRKKSERIICRANCNVCNTKPVYSPSKSTPATPYSSAQETKWLKSKGRFLSVGAAIMSNRNERAPDGLVADAHLSDGFLHLLLIKDCPHALYLWHLTQLAKKGGNPLNFDFVEHHKTPAFTFTSIGNESVWNLDGELFQAHKLSAQVFRGLICLFASGPEV